MYNFRSTKPTLTSILTLVVTVAAASRPVPVTAREAQVAPVPIESLLRRETIRYSGLSANGRWLALITMRIGREDSQTNGQKIATNTLQVIETATGRSRVLTPPGCDSATFSWSPAGESLAFDAQCAATHELWLWQGFQHAERRVVDTVQLRPGDILWTHDGHALIASFAPLESNSARSTPTAAQKRDSPAISVYRAGMNGTSSGVLDYSTNNYYQGDLARIQLQNSSVTWLTHGGRPQAYRLSPDGDWIAYATLRGQAGGSGYRNLFDIVVVPVQANEPARTVASDVESMSTVMSLSWSPDSRWIAWLVRHLHEDSPEEEEVDCYVADLTSESRSVMKVSTPDEAGATHWSTARPPLWSGDGRFFVLVDRGILWRVQSTTALARPLASVPDRSIQRLIAPRTRDYLEVGKPLRSILVITRDERTRRDGISRLNLRNGRTQRLFEAAVNLSTGAEAKIDVSSNGRVIVFPRESADQTEQLWISDPELRSPRAITHLAPELEHYRFGRSRLISWHTAEGVQLHGALILPSDYRDGQRYPLVVEIYGGDSLSDGLNQFGGSNGTYAPSHNLQLLATRGFAVLSADSYTHAGATLRDIAASVLPGVDVVIAQGIARADALGVMGRSNGGYGVFSLLVQTQRFKAAVVASGFADLVSMYGQMHLDGSHWAMSWLEQKSNMGGTLWDYRQRYVENSPIFYFDRVATPVLLLQGTDDTAVAAYLADEAFMALQRLGKPVEYAKYLDEGHVFTHPANQRDAAERTIRWFEDHLQRPSND
jgi:dipeptidyl aminopeptidase/acylaminoacyl peptidase